MAKLTAKNKFFDLSDYGRYVATLFAQQLKSTRFTPIHVTLLFGIAGLMAIFCIVKGHYYFAGFFLILKSILDAADGELARVKNAPSYTGRYLDSVFDIILNFLFLLTIGYITQTSAVYTLLAFIAVQLQGTLYNYYYVILRNKLAGSDTTSKIFENKAPKAFPGENQKAVNILFAFYNFFYALFDKTIYFLDKGACKVKTFPNWFMTLVSFYGLGFQLLIIAVMLPMHLIQYIIPFFIGYSIFIPVLIGIRKLFLFIQPKNAAVIYLPEPKIIFNKFLADKNNKLLHKKNLEVR
jgi:phosphatidylglycerophosphate synthase